MKILKQCSAGLGTEKMRQGMCRCKYKQCIETKVRKETWLTCHTVMAVPTVVPVYESKTWINKNKKVIKIQEE